MKRSLVLIAALTMGLGACEFIGTVLGALSDLSLLGVSPAAGFSQANSPDRGKLRIAVGAVNDSFVPVLPKAKDLKVKTASGEEVPVEETEEVEGHEKGSFVLLVDGSYSTSWTDPDRVRVEAVRALADQLSACGNGWEQALMEFGVLNGTNGFDVTAVRARYTDDADAIDAAADDLGSWEETPLWDSTYEVLEDLAAEYDTSFSGDTKKAGMGIVVLSDGADTVSRHSRADVVTRANELGIRVHTVGFGPAADGDLAQDEAAIEGLRRMADETGGYYGYVSTVDELPALAEAVASAQCGGHTQLVVTWPEAEPDQTYDGSIVYKDNDAIAVPFRFTSPGR